MTHMLEGRFKGAMEEAKNKGLSRRYLRPLFRIKLPHLLLPSEDLQRPRRHIYREEGGKLGREAG